MRLPSPKSAAVASGLLFAAFAAPVPAPAASAPAASVPVASVPAPSAPAPSAPAASGSDLAAHRALYQLTLGSAQGDVAAATGTMAYEVLDACDGWATRQRLDMTVTNRDGQDIKMVSDYTTWESKNGTRLRFQTKQTTDTAVTSEVAGEATKSAASGSVQYTTPADTRIDLPPGTLFPMEHTGAIIAGAEAGKKFLAIPLFDGTSAEGAQNSSIAITSWEGPKADKWPDLAKLPSGKVHVAFFDRKDSAQQPDYEVTMRYWQNGVADDLAMDFGDFTMNGKLVEFKLQPSGC